MEIDFALALGEHSTWSMGGLLLWPLSLFFSQFFFLSIFFLHSLVLYSIATVAVTKYTCIYIHTSSWLLRSCPQTDATS